MTRRPKSDTGCEQQQHSGKYMYVQQWRRDHDPIMITLVPVPIQDYGNETWLRMACPVWLVVQNDSV